MRSVQVQTKLVIALMIALLFMILEIVGGIYANRWRASPLYTFKLESDTFKGTSERDMEQTPAVLAPFYKSVFK